MFHHSWSVIGWIHFPQFLQADAIRHRFLAVAEVELFDDLFTEMAVTSFRENSTLGM